MNNSNNKPCAGDNNSTGDQYSSFNAIYAAIDLSWKVFAAYWYGREGLRSSRGLAGQ